MIRRTPMTDPRAYDLIVIGSGPAGEKAAAQAAYFGKRVALVERAPYLGGAGINTGTVPSKTLRETALYYSGIRQRGLYGVDYHLGNDLTISHFMHREREVVDSLRAAVERNVARHGIDLIRGTARFEDTHTVVVSGAPDGARRHSAPIILVATGSVPNRGADLPTDDPRFYDSDSILTMSRLPPRLAVVGAGVIGCEYACIFAVLGIAVHLIDGRTRLLGFLDGETADRLRLQMELLGVRMALGDGVTAARPDPEVVRLDLKSGATLEADAVLVAAGRLGNTAGLGLERVGIAVDDRGHIRVNGQFQTQVSHIYAAGDVIGFPGLAATSMEQGRVAICHAFGFGYKTAVSPVLPLTVYSIPEVSMVGETEESCREKGRPYCVGRAEYRGNARGQIVGDLAGQVKLVFDPHDRRLLGVHIVGEDAAELIHVGAMVLQTQGTIDAFIDAVFNYPSLGEAYKYAAYDGLGALARRRS
jgi:NAD(P) transhydrogenase